MGFIVDGGFVAAFLLGPEFCAEPVAQERDNVVCGDRTGQPAGMAVEEEAVSDAHGMAKEQVHLHVAVALEGGFVDGLVRGGHDGHGKVKAPEAVSAHIFLGRCFLRQDKDLVLDIPLHHGDGHLQGICLFYVHAAGFVVVCKVSVLDAILRQDKLLGVVHGESLDENHGKPWVGEHL